MLGRALGPVKLGFETLCALDPGQAREVVLGALKALDPGRRFSGDDSRGVMCTVDPQSSQFHADVAAMAKRVSDHVIPKTRAYHEIWYGDERVASSEPEEPFYGRTYMPRKFKIGFALPPSNDIDVYAQDLGFIAIGGPDGLEGFNVVIGGGMGRTDLVFQRIIEIWGGTPSLYIIIILFAILGRSFWLLVAVSILFGWPALVGVVRAEFLRARNFEYVRAARALGVQDRVIMFRHILPNAMVATVTLLPFIVTGAIGGLASLDFLGFGLPSSAPSLGELSLQAKQNLQAPWLGFTAFFTFAIMLSLLVFVFEGVRDAFDPRKTFQ